MRPLSGGQRSKVTTLLGKGAESSCGARAGPDLSEFEEPSKYHHFAADDPEAPRRKQLVQVHGAGFPIHMALYPRLCPD